MPTQIETASLIVHICAERRGYKVTFSNEEQAIAFLTPKTSTHTWWEISAEDHTGTGSVPMSWTKLQDFLYPACEHGLSLDLCSGPNHYMTADQEQAMGWDYSDAPAGF